MQTPKCPKFNGIFCTIVKYVIFFKAVAAPWFNFDDDDDDDDDDNDDDGIVVSLMMMIMMTTMMRTMAMTAPW